MQFGWFDYRDSQIFTVSGYEFLDHNQLVWGNAVKRSTSIQDYKNNPKHDRHNETAMRVLFQQW